MEILPDNICRFDSIIAFINIEFPFNNYALDWLELV